MHFVRRIGKIYFGSIEELDIDIGSWSIIYRNHSVFVSIVFHLFAQRFTFGQTKQLKKFDTWFYFHFTCKSFFGKQAVHHTVHISTDDVQRAV